MRPRAFDTTARSALAIVAGQRARAPGEVARIAGARRDRTRHSLAHLGGNIRIVDNTSTSISIRNNSFVRDTTPWHAGVVIDIAGGRLMGIFLRDQSTLALQNPSSRVSITGILRAAPQPESRALYVQQHAHAFGGKYTIADVDVGFQAAWHSYINVDVEAARVGTLAWALKFSTVALERPGALTDIATIARAHVMSLAAVGDLVVNSCRRCNHDESASARVPRHKFSGVEGGPPMGVVPKLTIMHPASSVPAWG